MNLREKIKSIDWLDKYFNNLFLILSVIFLFLIKILSDSLLYFFGDIYSTIAVTWKIVISILITASLSMFTYKKIIAGTDSINNNIKTYYNELLYIIYLTLGIIVANFFVPESITNYGPIPNYFSLLYIELLSLYFLITGLYIIYFLYKWLMIRKFRRTKKYIKILSYSLLALIVLEIPFHYYRVSVEDLASNPVVVFLSVVIILMILLVVFLSTNKNSWIAILPKRKKLKLLLLYFIGIILSFVFIAKSIDQSGDSKLTVAVQFLYSADTILFMAYYCLVPYFFRLMFSTLAALPTTEIVERTTSELSSLTYLNRLAAKTIKMDELLHTVTDLALQTCRGIASWTELYENGKVRIVSTQFLSESHLLSIDINQKLYNFLRNLDKPELVPSLDDNEDLRELNWKVLPLVKSIIAVPLFAGTDRIGSLVILHPEEYGLEQTDLRVMEAFGDNVNLALENAKLIKDSIEKERYERELVLAREMEEKLLPRNLPKLLGYSIAAFSIPADEVGGDYYDIVKIKNNKTCILIGDVSGKGMSAAFYMAQLKGVVMAVAPDSESASDILCRINSALFKRIEKHMYITLSALVIDNEQGKVSFARAGHTPILFKNSNGIELIKPNGIGIALANMNFFRKNIEEVNFIMVSNDICLLFTDGINELRNSENHEFGYDSLKLFLKNRVYNESADEIVCKLTKEINSYRTSFTPHDDMTCVTLVAK